MFDAQAAIDSFTGRFRLKLPAGVTAKPIGTAVKEDDNSFVPPEPSGSTEADSDAENDDGDSEPAFGGDFEVELEPPAS